MKENKEKKVKLEDLLIIDYANAKSTIFNKSKYYLVTWEQNSTELHENLWKNILAYKNFLNAELIVCIGKHKNTQFPNKKLDTWNTETKPYWCSKEQVIHKNLSIRSDVKATLTIKQPLTSIENLSGEKSVILGHPKLHYLQCPVFNNRHKRALFSTGSITLPNYPDTISGKIAEERHKYGFIIVEIKNEEEFFIRQVEAKSDGSFIDLYYTVINESVVPTSHINTIVWGDTHIGCINQKVLNSTKNLIYRFNIQTEVHHDIFDGESVNNHMENDPIGKYFRAKENKNSIKEEIEETKEFIRNLPKHTNKIIIQSNHNDRLDRYVKNIDWKYDVENAKEFSELLNLSLTDEVKGKGLIAYILEKEFPNIKCMKKDEYLQIDSYEIANHGHEGCNGARGNNQSFYKMNLPMISGHSHTPYRKDNYFVVGTSTNLRLNYNSGASSWINSHVVIHNNNIAQHIIMNENGEFSTLPL